MDGRPVKRHFDYIDGVRGIAACLVMIQHTFEHVGLLSLERGSFSLTWINPGEIGVVAFFFVSGFVIPFSMEKRTSLSQFWLNRIFRIYPLYLALYLVTAGLVAAGIRLVSQIPLGDIPKNFLVHMFFVQEFFETPNLIGVAWTLSLEAVWYALFTILAVLGWNQKNVRVTLMAASFAILACAITLYLIRLPMGRVGLLLVCALGLLFLRLELDQIRRRQFLLLSGFLMAVIVVGLVIGFGLRPGSSPIAPSLRCVLISWTLGAGLFWIAFFHRRWRFIANPIVRYLGKISYSIYLLHSLVIGLCVPPLMDIFGNPFPAVLAVMAGTIGLSAATYRFIEAPAITFSHRLASRRLAQSGR